MAENYETKSGTMEMAIFQVGSMPCGLETSLIQEIIKNFTITTVHRAPDFVRGVINLRGQITTVIDLHQKFTTDIEDDINSMEIVVVLFNDEPIGLLVNSVSDVVIIDKENMTAPPANVKGITGSFFRGILKMEQQLVSVLNLTELIKK